MSSGSSPPIALAIPAFNGATTLGVALGAARRLDPRPAELLVVDDGSTDSTAEVALACGARVVSHGRNRGLACARNTAIEETRSPFIVFIDDDVLVPTGLLGILAAGFDATDVGGVGGRESACGSGASGWDRWRLAFRPQSHGPAALGDVWMLPGLCAAYRREALLDVGGFDPYYFTNGEDVDLGVRLRRAGWKLAYRPEAEVVHIRRDGPASLLSLCWRYGFWAAKALAVNGEPAMQLLRGQFRWTLVSTWSSLRRMRSPSLAAASPLLGAATVAGICAGSAAGRLAGKAAHPRSHRTESPRERPGFPPSRE